MVGTMIGPMLSLSQKETKDQLNETEQVIIDMLNSYSRVALFTEEFDDIQIHFDSLGADPHIRSIYLINTDQIIVASSQVESIGNEWQIEDAYNANYFIDVRNTANRMGSLAVSFSHDGYTDVIERTRKRSMIIAAAGMSIIAGVGLLTGFLLTRRLNLLSRTARQVSEGDLQARSPVSGHDEIGLLSSTFNKMADSIEDNVNQLQHREQQLEKIRSELEKRVTERTIELEIARDAALDSSRVKSAFLANMSHELRTPLNAVIGYAEILFDDLGNAMTPDAQEDIDKIISSSTHLLNLINNILDLSKIEAGKIELYIEEFDVEDIINDCCMTVKTAAAANNNTLICPQLNSNIVIASDMTKLRQIILNLLSNACKFTKQGEVSVNVQSETRNNIAGVTIEVNDSGIGMTDEQLGIIFNEFSQADASTTRKYGGTGLGLTLTKRFVETLGGYINVNSIPDEGSTFIVWLPRQNDALKNYSAFEE